MNQEIRDALATVAIAMPIVIGVLHAARAITTRLRVYALTTPEKWDDVATARVLRLLDGLDAIVDAVSLVIPGPPRPLNPTPHYEAIEGESTAPETPSAKRREP